MDNSADMEIYIQRYETFRHLDQMRYQAQNIAVLVGTLFAGYAAGVDGEFHPILGFIVGTVLVSFGFTMFHISRGIVRNSKVLNEFGRKIGDSDLPVVSLGWRTATFWTTAVTIAVGAGLTLFSICRLDW